MSELFSDILRLRESLVDLFISYKGVLQAVSVIVSIGLLGGIIFLVIKLQLVNSKVEKLIDVIGAEALTKRRSVRAWRQIQKRLELGGEANSKLALIEADKILDELLKIAGYKGETMADRLKKITAAQLSNIEAIWQAHKIRNRLVHEPDYHLSDAEARIAINIYKKSFQEMGLIDQEV